MFLNILFAILAGILANYIFAEAKVTSPLRVILAVIVGVIVFMLNLAQYVVI